LEMAGGAVEQQSCRAIAMAIAAHLDALTLPLLDAPERHHSVQATFEHSWQLLPVEEQQALRGLAVFQGGFSEAAAAEVAGTSPVLLANLIDKSLLQQEQPGRYSFHTLIHQYLGLKLQAETVERTKIQAAHSRYFAAFLQQWEEVLKGGQ